MTPEEQLKELRQYILNHYNPKRFQGSAENGYGNYQLPLGKPRGLQKGL